MWIKTFRTIISAAFGVTLYVIVFCVVIRNREPIVTSENVFFWRRAPNFALCMTTLLKNGSKAGDHKFETPERFYNESDPKLNSHPLRVTIKTPIVLEQTKIQLLTRYKHLTCVWINWDLINDGMLMQGDFLEELRTEALFRVTLN